MTLATFEYKNKKSMSNDNDRLEIVNFYLFQ